jgi:hypothetical protein
LIEGILLLRHLRPLSFPSDLKLKISDLNGNLLFLFWQLFLFIH